MLITNDEEKNKQAASAQQAPAEKEPEAVTLDTGIFIFGDFKQGLFTLEIGRTNKGMATESKFGPTDPFMKGTGKTIKLAERGNQSMLMGMSTMVSGLTTRRTGMVSISTTTVLSTPAIGRTISSMVRVERVGQTGLTMRDSTRKERSTVTGNSSSLMVRSTKGSSTTTTSTARV